MRRDVRGPKGRSLWLAVVVDPFVTAELADLEAAV